MTTVGFETVTFGSAAVDDDVDPPAESFVAVVGPVVVVGVVVVPGPDPDEPPPDEGFVETWTVVVTGGGSGTVAVAADEAVTVPAMFDVVTLHRNALP